MTDKPDLGALDPVDLAQRLIRCPSVTPEEGGALDLLERVLGGLGFTCHRLAFSEPGAAEVENLYARLGAAGPNFCYAGHTDVVPVGDAKAWGVDPFAAEIVDGALYGRGAADMKGSIAAFLAARDSFYLASASAEGRPYIQHRGGPKGFLKVLDAGRLAFADFGGNRQYITAGNLSENDRASIFLMDYPNRRRVKLWGRARVVEDDPELLARLVEPGYRAKPERAILFEVEAWDVNCPQHIPPRYTEDQIAPALAKLQARIDELEVEVKRLSGE